jgi:T5orf172 domain
MSVVYVAVAESGPTKVGISKNPWARLSGLKKETKRPVALNFIGQCESAEIAAHIEHRVHEILWRKRYKGEWFSVAVEEAVAAVLDAVAELGYEMKRIPVDDRRKRGRPATGQMGHYACRLPDWVGQALADYTARMGLRSTGEALREVAKGWAVGQGYRPEVPTGARKPATGRERAT